MYFLVDLFSGNEAKISDLILLYNCPYKLSYILSDSLFINSLNWSVDIGITRTEEVLVEEGTEEVLEEEGTEGIEEGTEGIEQGTKVIEEGREGEEGTEGIEEGTEEDDVNSDSDNGIKFKIFIYCNCSSTEWAICLASVIVSFNVLRPLL